MNSKRLSNTFGPRTKFRKVDLRFVVLLLLLIIAAMGLYAIMSLSSGASQVPTVPALHAQMGATHLGLESSPWSFSLLASTSEPNDFRLSFTKLGLSSGSYQRTLYDSETNSFRLNNISTTTSDDDGTGRLSLSQKQSQHQSNRQISDSDSSDLRQVIENSTFFQSDSVYPPSNESPNDTYDAVYVLTIEMNNNLHTVIWTDSSENIPVSLLSIAKTLERIYSR